MSASETIGKLYLSLVQTQQDMLQAQMEHEAILLELAAFRAEVEKIKEGSPKAAEDLLLLGPDIRRLQQRAQYIVGQMEKIDWERTRLQDELRAAGDLREAELVDPESAGD